MKFRLRYNAPVVLTLTLLATAIQIVSEISGDEFRRLLALPGSFDFAAPMNYMRLFTYVVDHESWDHLLGNFMSMLLIGPMLEEKYGSLSMLFMVVVTALITAILYILFFEQGLLGASGVVFMMILLSSFTNIRSGEIPITFILVALLFLGAELVKVFEKNQVSQFAHILGGLMGAGFGFLLKERNGTGGAPKVPRRPLPAAEPAALPDLDAMPDLDDSE